MVAVGQVGFYETQIPNNTPRAKGKVVFIEGGILTPRSRPARALKAVITTAVVSPFKIEGALYVPTTTPTAKMTRIR